MKKILFGFLAVIAIAVIFLLVVGWTNPNFEYGNSIVINRPPATCYNILTDTVQMRKWMPGFKSQKLLSGTDKTAGAEYEFVLHDSEKMTMHQRVIEWKAPEKMSYELSNDVLTSTYSYELSGDSQTTLTTSYVVEGNNVFMKAILYFSRSYLKDQDLKTLESFKNAAESQN